MKFLDQVKIYVKAGNGGSGSPSFRREKFVEFGGPDGGDGGKGGSVILISERNLNTLIDYRYQQHFKAERGKDGSGKNKTGKGGEDLYLKVPVNIYRENNIKKTEKKVPNKLVCLIFSIRRSLFLIIDFLCKFTLLDKAI